MELKKHDAKHLEGDIIKHFATFCRNVVDLTGKGEKHARIFFQK